MDKLSGKNPLGGDDNPLEETDGAKKASPLSQDSSSSEEEPILGAQGGVGLGRAATALDFWTDPIFLEAGQTLPRYILDTTDSTEGTKKLLEELSKEIEEREERAQEQEDLASACAYAPPEESSDAIDARIFAQSRQSSSSSEEDQKEVPEEKVVLRSEGPKEFGGARRKSGFWRAAPLAGAGTLRRKKDPGSSSRPGLRERLATAQEREMNREREKEIRLSEKQGELANKKAELERKEQELEEVEKSEKELLQKAENRKKDSQ